MTYFIMIESFKGKVDPFWKEIAIKIRNMENKVSGFIKGISFDKQLGEKENDFGSLLDEIIMFEVPWPHDMSAGAKVSILLETMKLNFPSVLFLGFTHQGAEIGPALAWNLKVPLITNCVEIDLQGGVILAKRAMHGGKYLATIKADISNSAIFSIQKGAWKTKDRKEYEKLNLPKITKVPWNSSWSATDSEVLGIIEDKTEKDQDITRANVLVSVGRGIGGAENLQIIKDLAHYLHGMISCSRPIVDLGILPPSYQVGISGKSVSPIIYLALGISGQANHLAGINSASMVIAVNKDPQAPIFQIADYGIVGEYVEVVSELTEVIKKRQQNERLETKH